MDQLEVERILRELNSSLVELRSRIEILEKKVDRQYKELREAILEGPI